MRNVCLLLGLLVGWTLAAPLAQAAPRDEVPLKIVSKSSDGRLGSSILGPPPANYTLSLRNDSDKTVTAWKFSCVYAQNDGNFAVASLEEDSFFPYELGIVADSSKHGPVEPGDVREIVVPRDETTAPYAAMSCGVDAVVFADASHSGVASVTDRIFGDRARTAADAVKAIEILDGMREGSRPAASEPLGTNRYAEELREAELSAQAGDEARLGEVLAYLREQVEMVERHLPERWRQRVSGLDSRKERGQ